jgi:uncharacterized protein YdeI (YjbR/CyaY-like superfamily)
MPAPAEIRSKVRFFATTDDLRAWFEEHHDRASELWIGYYRQGTGKPGVTYPEAVLEALCFGWIDGQVRSLDAVSYTNRYSPRRPASRWSAINRRQARMLISAGRMHTAGRAAFERGRGRPAIRATPGPVMRPLDVASRRTFQTKPAAWKFFRDQPPGYRRLASSWVMSAVRPETRMRRLGILIRACGARRRVDLLSPTREPPRSP